MNNLEPIEENNLKLSVKQGNPLTVSASGELNYENCNQLGSLIWDTLDGGQETALALEGLDFIDSSGLRVLVKAAHRALQIGYPLKIISLTPQLNHMLEICGLRQFFNITQLFASPSYALREHRKAGSLSFDVPGCISACRVARNEVCSFAERMGFDSVALYDIKLAVEEAFSNAVRHGACCD
jgi:stage II sporulation protein AA (anti-sigma F factor antagonist)